MLTLYDIPLSPFAQKVKIALLEKGLEFDTRAVSFADPPSELAELNPRAEVPILVDRHDGEATAVWDSTIILDYLEDRSPEPTLWPSSPAERARVRQLEEVCDTQFDAVNWGVYDVTYFQRAEGEEAAALLDAARHQLWGLYNHLERQLDGREWFNGDAFGRGDLAAYPFVSASWALFHKTDEDAPLARWLARCRERPSIQRVRDDLRTFLQEQRGAPIGSRRTYRGHRLDWMMRSGGRAVVERGIEADTIAFSNEIG
jgi:glutathione S-transferase/RNA polymerase-associated protein